MRRASSCPRHCASTFWTKSSKRLPGFPIVLHGSSSVPQEFVTDDQRSTAARCPTLSASPRSSCVRLLSGAVCKINIDSDLRLAMTASIRKYFSGASGSLRSAPVPEARPHRHQEHGRAQVGGRSGLQRQGLICQAITFNGSASVFRSAFIMPAAARHAPNPRFTWAGQPRPC